jgi:diguanylate cyclase
MSTEEAAYWKERYFTLLNEGEKRHEEQNKYESMLSRAVVRLTLATSGLDPQLDPHLQSIREVMRKGQAATVLGKELDALLDSLIRTPKSGDAAGTAPVTGQELLRFLEAQCVSRTQRKEFEALKRRFEAGGYAEETELFKGAARLLRPANEDPAAPSNPEPPPERKGVIGKLFGKAAAPAAAAAPAPANGLDCRRLRQRLDELLQALPPPEALAPRVEQLRLKLADDAEDLIGLFDAAASLIGEMGAQHWNEQKQLCDFLASLILLCQIRCNGMPGGLMP